jgi:peptide/nickel transport system permease protein
MVATAPTIEQLSVKEVGQLASTWRRFRRHRLGLIGLITLTALIASVIAVPLLSPFTYDNINDAVQFAPVGAVDSTGLVHLLGTDDVGRDNLTRLFYAGRISLTVGLVTTLCIVLVGALVGSLAGFYGGWVDTLLMRLVDLLLSLPTLPILLVLSKMLDSSGAMDRLLGKDVGTMATIILVLTLFGWMGLSRLVRGSILSLRTLDFIDASRALGSSNSRIILRHLLPNSMVPLIVAATLAVGDFIISESFLSFLGLGIQPPTPSWGNLLQGAQEFGWYVTDLNPTKEIRGYLILFPGVLILLTVLSINFLGDALRDALDPRLKL